jgi:hypothetical protein
MKKMGWGHLKILFLRTMKPKKKKRKKKAELLSDMEQRQVDYIMDPQWSNGANGNKMLIIFLYGPRLLR